MWYDKACIYKHHFLWLISYFTVLAKFDLTQKSQFLNFWKLDKFVYVMSTYDTARSA